MKGKPIVGSPFFGAFSSDCIPKTTKGVNVQLFIHSSNSCIYASEFREHSETATYILFVVN